MGSSHQNSELCGTKEVKGNVVPSPGIPATFPRLSQNPHDKIRSRSLGQEVLGAVKKLVRTSPSCCKASWIGNCSSWDLVLEPAPEEGEIQRKAGCAVSTEEVPCVHLPWVHPHAGRNQVGTDYPLWPDMWEIGDPLRITCTFSDLGDILITQKPPLDNKKNKCLSLHLFVSEESYILLCRYT